MFLRDSLMFLAQFVRSPRATGALAPSSRRLARMMVDWIDWPQVQNAAEYGPGTGVFTQQIVERLRPDAKFFAIERNPRFVAMFNEQLPSVRVYQDNVKNVAVLCQDEGTRQLDAIVCGLPWASFSDEDQEEMMAATSSVLRAGGQFVTFAYWQGLLLPAGQRFRQKLSEHFCQIHRSPTVWINFPPAFVYRCRK